MLLDVKEVLGPNLKPDYSCVDVSCGFIQSLHAIVDNALKQVMTTSYSILYNSPFYRSQHRSWKSVII
jgi:hypothetical protein